VPPVDCPPAVTAASRRALLGPGDAGLIHPVLQTGTLHCQAGSGTLRTAATLIACACAASAKPLMFILLSSVRSLLPLE